MNKIKNIISVIVFAVLLFSLSAFCILKPDTEYSESERRYLASLPELTVETLFNGNFMKNFEEYTVDQFPWRDSFRSVKAYFSSDILRKLDNNGLFVAEGHISKIDDKQDNSMLDYASDKFKAIYESYIKNQNCNTYFSVVPDKNFLLADKNGYPSIDYEDFIQYMKNKTDYMTYIDITDLLSLDDYYKTDTHWKQENIIDIAEKIADSMGTDISAEYTINTLDYPFYGVYKGQLAKNFKPDTIKYLTNDTIDNCKVSYYGTGKPLKGEIYDMKKAVSKDPYEIYLSGTSPLVTLENENARSEKELVLFRDSFGGSLAPLMIEGYKKITVVDIRYIQSGFIGNFVDFENCDVLFLYSTTLLNNSTALQ